MKALKRLIDRITRKVVVLAVSWKCDSFCPWRNPLREYGAIGLLCIKCWSAKPVASRQKLMQSNPLSPFRSSLWLVWILSKNMLPKFVKVNCPLSGPWLNWTASYVLSISLNRCFSSLAERNMVVLLFFAWVPVVCSAALPGLALLGKLEDTIID